MNSFEKMYRRLAEASAANRADEEIESIKKTPGYDEHHLECLLNPDKCAPVIRLGDCDCKAEHSDGKTCADICYFEAIKKDEKGNAVIMPDKCVGCSDCINYCRRKLLTDRKDLYPVFELLNKSDTPVFIMIAPAFTSQFDDNVTPGKLRSAFKQLGFAGMLEVALFADILTLKEALEFDGAIKNESDFLLTSCCCPIWIAMIKKIYSTLVLHLPPSVSPMVACGRSIKKLYPGAKTVFIGPCVAKKAEAKEKDIADAVDYVLNFKETKEIFDIAGINPAELEEDLRDHSSKAGRIYARTGGVSEAVKSTLARLKPERTIPLRAKQANGAIECKALLKELGEGISGINFIEGMGCVGGCVGGPKAIIPKEEGTVHVNSYGEQAVYETPADNPYVLELLGRLGFDTVESLLENDNMFIRKFI